MRLQDPPETLAWSLRNSNRANVIVQQSKLKRGAGLLPNSAAADGQLEAGAAGPVSPKAQSAAYLSAVLRVNASIPRRIGGFSHAASRLNAIVDNFSSIRSHYGHPISIDSKFILHSERQRMFCKGVVTWGRGWGWGRARLCSNKIYF